MATSIDALAGDQRFGLLEENDSLYFHSDKHYTQGLRLADLGHELAPESAWNRPFGLIGGIAPIFTESALATSRRYAVFLGQSLFTPKNLAVTPPDPRDRPYGGWLYAGASLLQESDGRMLENLELDLGTVGPASLGKQVQNDWHQFIGIGQARGWSDQIQNEPGIVMSYARLWRVGLIGESGSGVDIIPQLGGSLGNVFTYGEAGALLRIGKNMSADYGPVRIRPALSGTDYFDGDRLDGNLGYYFFAGVDGRAVGRNIFLDGNSFRQSRGVSKKALVGDLQAGFSLLWSSAIRVDMSVVRRTEEFIGQRTPDEIGTAAIAVSW